ncbi:uncharacterized protein V1510DRAFT_430213 [Dipodascopsis tothii]|uniref:uncharacterized protein n=1 Tax=Dipodascopsis tothii TaxID=44089 RepID=UPI0034CF3BE7
MGTLKRPVSPIPEYPRLRTRKACQICRRRKVKCDGATPSCGQCSIRGALCFYRDERGNDSPAFAATPEPTSPAGAGADAAPAAEAPLQSVLLGGVRATNPGTENYIYYGPSSTFSFIHHIHHIQREMDSPRAMPQSFRELFYTEAPERLLGFHGRQAHVPPPSFMAPALLDEFLDNYFATIGHILPVCTRPWAEAVLRRLYDPRAAAIETSEVATAVVVLATGAIMGADDSWGDSLYARAQQILAASDAEISLQRVKALLLIAHYQAMRNNLNAAYLLCGQAVRLAYAGGLHREFLSLSCEPTPQTVDRQRTLWSLFGFEMLLCVFTGRPSGFTPREIDTPLPADDFMRSIAQLSMIGHRAASLIYGIERKQLRAVWVDASHIETESQDFLRALPRALAFHELVRPGSETKVEPTAFALGCHFYLFRILIYRPYLLIDYLKRKQAADQNEPYEPRSILAEACRRAVEAGCHMLQLLVRAYSDNRLYAGMRFNTVFLQSASSILLFDLLRDMGNVAQATQSFELLSLALDCFRMTVGDGEKPSGLAMLEQVHERAHELYLQARAPTAAAAATAAAAEPDSADSAAAVPAAPAQLATPDFVPPPAAGPQKFPVFYSNLSYASFEDKAGAGADAADAADEDFSLLDGWDDGFEWFKAGFMMPTDGGS